MNNINWAVLADRHQRGHTEFGTVWIRTDKTGSVTGVYTLFGKTRKTVPKPNEKWNLTDGQTVAELKVEEERNFRNLVKELST